MYNKQHNDSANVFAYVALEVIGGSDSIGCSIFLVIKQIKIKVY